MKNRIFAVLLTVLVFFAAGGLPAAAEPNRPLVVVAAWEAAGIDPLVSGFIFTRMGCLETLVTSDRKGGMEPRLATKWSVSDDGLTWTFDLREGVVFHDGTHLTGEIAAASLNRTLARGSIFKGTPVKNFTGEGMKVLVTTETPFSPLPAYLVHYATAILAPASFDADVKTTKVLGTGFYRITSFQEGKIVDFEAFEGYWGEKAAIAKSRYFAVSNPETRALLAESGEGDIVVDIPSEAAMRLQENKNLIIMRQALPRVRLLALNSGLPIFSTPVLRHAVSLLIDRKGIATALLKNPEAASSQLFPPFSVWHNKELPPLEYNPEKGRALLKEEGWLADSKGMLTKDGHPFAFEILTYSDRPDLPVIAEVVQQALREEGIAVTIRVEKSGMIPERNKNGTLESAFLARNFGFVVDPIGTLSSDFAPENERSGWGGANWSSSVFSDAVEKYMKTFNKEDQAALRKTMASILQEELPIIPVAWYDNNVAVNKSIAGICLDPSEQRPYSEGVKWSE